MKPTLIRSIFAASVAVLAGMPLAHAADFTMKIGFATRADQNEDWAN